MKRAKRAHEEGEACFAPTCLARCAGSLLLGVLGVLGFFDGFAGAGGGLVELVAGLLDDVAWAIIGGRGGSGLFLLATDEGNQGN